MSYADKTEAGAERKAIVAYMRRILAKLERREVESRADFDRGAIATLRTMATRIETLEHLRPAPPDQVVPPPGEGG